MRLASFVESGNACVGLVEGDVLINVGKHLPAAPRGIRGLLEQNYLTKIEALLGKGYADADAASVTYLPVVPDAQKIFLVLLNYESDRIAQGRPKLTYPHLMTRFADSQVGHRAPLVVPKATKEFDFEGELAVVIGKSARSVTKAEAMNHVAGYACYNDCGARDFMRHTRHFTAGKNFPGSAGFGPWLTTHDEAPTPADMHLVTRLNGEVYQDACPGELTFPIDELIAYISTFTELRPGDVISTGTPAGAGQSRSPARFLRPGDVVEVEISGLGVLSNPCVAE